MKKGTLIIILLLIPVFIYLKIKPAKYIQDKDNFLTCADCYLYARYSLELLKGSYGGIDILRNIPEHIPYPNPPPLISLLPVWISKLTGIGIDNLFLYLPPLLSLMFILPLYLWARQFTNLPTILGGITLGAFGYMYFMRTTVGRFDTDSLILFFLFLIVFLLYKATSQRSLKGWLYLGLSLLSFHIFMWWYYKPVIGVLFLGGLMILTLYDYLVKGNYIDTLIKTVIFGFGIIPYMFSLNFGTYLERLLRLDTNIVFSMPSIQKHIVELQPLSLEGFINSTTENTVTFLLSVAGLIALILKNPRHMIMVLPFIALGFTAFTGAGNRMAIYINPFLGLGFGYSIYLLISYLFKRLGRIERFSLSFASLLSVIFLIPSNSFYYIPKPVFSDELFRSLKELKANHTTRFWTWWDYGYLIQYASGGATHIDNGNHNPYKIFLFSKSMTEKDDEKAFRIISYTSSNIVKGKITPEELYEKAISYNNKPPVEDIYVLITNDMLRMSPIYLIGGIETNEPLVWFSTKCSEQQDGWYNCMLIQFNVNNFNFKGDANIVRRITEYKKIIFVNHDNGKTIVLNEVPDGKDRVVLFVYKGGDLYYYDVYGKAYRTLLYRLYFSTEKFRHFELVLNKFPQFVIYKLR